MQAQAQAALMAQAEGALGGVPGGAQALGALNTLAQGGSVADLQAQAQGALMGQLGGMLPGLAGGAGAEGGAAEH